MKNILLVVMFIFSLLVQLFFLQSWQSVTVTANIVIAFIVVACLFAKLELMLWLGFFAGMAFDMNANGNFGLGLGFYLLLVLVCKYFLKFGEREYSWWKAAGIAAVSALAQATLLTLPTLLSGRFWGSLANVVYYSVLTFIAACIWYLVLGQLFELADKINLRGALKR